MVFSELVYTSVKALNSNKIRSFLTMLGVIIGVYAVVALVAVGNGIKNSVTAQFNDLGSNLILIAPGKVDFADDPAKFFSRNKLDEKHLKLIEKHAGEFVAEVTPSVRVGQTIIYKDKEFYSTVIGAGENVTEIFNFKVAEGEFFTKNDVRSKKKVAMLGPILKEELFGSADAIGKKVDINGDLYEVIAIKTEQNASFDENIFVPYTSAMETLGAKNFSSMAVKAKDIDEIDSTIRQIELALLRDLDDDEFTVLSQSDILASIQSILGILTAGIGAIAGISLLVGGIGIMNIMLVSVTERIREIGLRKAVGASSYVIGLQFMIEAIILSATGGTIGMVLGWLTSIAISSFIQADVSINAVVGAFSFSVIVGVVFGTYPAISASRLDPIEALRYE